jgi:predicted RNA binding protein YcfA (HicA-like mRNA interferase family)
MNGLPLVRPRQLIRALQRAGFVVHHVRGSHYYLRHPEKPGLLVTVPYHRLLMEQVAPNLASRLSTGERAAAWRQAAKGLPGTPLLSDEAIGRESIYGDRG